MKTKVYYFSAIIVIVAAFLFVSKMEVTDGSTRAGGGLSLKELNDDTTTTSVVTVAEANATSEECLAQITTIANWTHQYGWAYVGADVVATASTQFGIMCPTYDVKAGVDFGTFRIEGTMGNFTRNSLQTKGFDPQFANFCIILGEPAPVKNATQLAFISKGTKVMIGQQGGTDFYTFDGDYYACAEQKIKNISLGGGIDFGKATTGYAAVKWMWHDNTFTMTGSKIGGEDRCLIASYVHDNIPVGKGVAMSVGSAFWCKPDPKGLHLVTGFSKGRVKLFTEAGAHFFKTFSPVFGVGINYKL